MSVGEKYWAVLDAYWDALSIDSPHDFEHTFSQVPRPVGLLYAAHFCQSEVCNGGFTQFFWNSTGVLAPEAIEGFNAIGQVQVAAIVAQAVSLLGVPYPRNRADRWRALERLADPTADESLPPSDQETFKQVEAFRPIEDQFYSLISNERGGFETAADDYADGVHLASRDPH